jgi:uncharacterized protein (DUF983 family)
MFEKFGKESIGCEFCGAGYGKEHEDDCPVFLREQRKKKGN